MRKRPVKLEVIKILNKSEELFRKRVEHAKNVKSCPFEMKDSRRE